MKQNCKCGRSSASLSVHRCSWTSMASATPASAPETSMGPPFMEEEDGMKYFSSSATTRRVGHHHTNRRTRC
ncbi:hypothetical protein KC338_g293 [Hortaea werneckii]|nr:hypothetical protein KC338_g293 [Hortaea werneckii]